MANENIWDILSRAQTGSLCLEKDFLLKRYWPKVKELVKNYDITYTPEILVPTDTTLIDDTYKAAFDLLIDVGILCTDTCRIITITENEVKEALKNLPQKVTLGEGKDSITFNHHRLGDDRPPVVIGGPTTGAVSEEMAYPIYLSYAKEPLMDVMYVAFLETIDGTPILPGSPWELKAEIRNIEYVRRALTDAGKPGMPLYGSAFPSIETSLSVSSPEYGYKKTDLRTVWPLPSMKVDFKSLFKAAHYITYQTNASSAGQGYIGSMTGGPETSLITALAEALALTVLFQTKLIRALPRVQGVGDSELEAIWSGCLAHAALARNTNLITTYGLYQYSGPCTETIFYELAAQGIAGAAIGCHVYGTKGNSGLLTDYCTGIETRFRAEIAHAALSIKPDNATELIKELESKYGNLIKTGKTPKGKRFQECYDIKTVTPSKGYLEIYNKVKGELENLGLTFKT